MHIIATDNPKDTITQLKCQVEAGQIRLTFLWPLDVDAVYIFKIAQDLDKFDIESAEAADAKLLTLQEYKKQGGYTFPRPSGAFTYRVYPFIRKDGEDYAIVYKGSDNSIEVTGQIPIRLSIREKTGFLGREKVYTITLIAQQSIAGDVLCYVKKEHGYPSDVLDGMMYFFGDGLVAGVPANWEVKVKKNEYIRVFVRDPKLAEVYIIC